jgi:serine O-acetyltransferase
MIESFSDYKFYLEADKVSLRIEEAIEHKSDFAIAELLKIWKFQRLLRKIEYYKNCKCEKSLVWIPYYKFFFINLSSKVKSLAIPYLRMFLIQD